MPECACCHGECRHAFCVGKVPLFSGLDGTELSYIASLIRHQTYAKGDTLFAEGEHTDALTIVNEGSVKAYRVTPDGREQILYIFGEGDFLGERNLFGGQTASYAVEALETVKTCSFTRDSFHALLYDHPDIAIKVIEELESRIARMENAMQTIGVRSLDSRISALLLEFAERFGSSVPEGVLIRLPLSREGMANYLGIARETVSRKLGQMETDGMIRSVTNKSLLVLDREALAALAGTSE